MKAPFITFEGGEGSGKSTQIKLLAEYLKQKSVDVVVTKEPGGTPIGVELRRLLVEGAADKMDANAEALLFFADRRIHMTQLVWPALENGKWVISDRFADSTTAYQYYAYNKRLSKEDIDMLYQFAVGDFKPDLTIILDIDPKVGLSRSFKKAEGMKTKETRNENRVLEFHQNLRQGYIQIAKQEPDRCVVLNAEQTIEALHQDVLAVIKDKFGI
ncbi:MAG TPA: dTMP kinase [Alphaproteobacteria bacterium]|nr:dTMP kinase [Alphaproteobacteria bacterium]